MKREFILVLRQIYLIKFLKLSGTLRADKNENFDLNFSPAMSIVLTPTEKDVIRFSFSSAIRNPTLSDQYFIL